VQAELAGRDAPLDLAVLRLAAPSLTAAPWAEASETRVGHLVLAVERPGRSARAALGIVSALGESWRTPRGGRVDRYLQTDLAPRLGFSGSLLVDTEGRALGMNTSGLVRGTALALPVATLRRAVEDILAHGGARRGFLGIGTIPVRLPAALATQAGSERALLIVSVQSGSPADRAGLLLGDVLHALGHKPVEQIADLLEALGDAPAGEASSVRLLRGGEPRELSVTLGTRTD
jgi:S1-C subfamily serine protease